MLSVTPGFTAISVPMYLLPVHVAEVVTLYVPKAGSGDSQIPRPVVEARIIFLQLWISILLTVTTGNWLLKHSQRAVAETLVEAACLSIRDGAAPHRGIELVSHLYFLFRAFIYTNVRLLLYLYGFSVVI